ncbi:hypothetical protein ACE3MS_15500 [Paenibacillus dendritiformis]|uniref:hypothetical protein n=1 Tax=Paenibacillus dendritiformis TaxID=130049 RepID=UPI00364707FC
MINVFLSIDNNAEVILLPVPPPEFTVTSPWKNEQADGLKQSLNLIGLRGLKTIEFSSFFPALGHDYPFLQNRNMWGMEYVDAIEGWRDKRYPFRLVISDSNGKQGLNTAVTLDEFEWQVKQDGDIAYTMKLTEFVFVDTKRKW